MEKLLIALFVCHYLADFTHLSTPTMLAAKRTGTPIGPIAIHASTHATLMGLAMVIMLSVDTLTLLFPLMAFQFITHLIIDVLKGRMNVWVPSVSNPANKSHWYIFGLDQLLHAIVIIVMAHFATA